ncbi:MAG: hypothetical protein AAB227_06415 [Pseudomonadota bacterium]
MIDLMRAIGERGENALRRSLWAFAGAGLLVLASGFAAAAIVDGLATLMPRYLALGLGALVLLIAAGVCFARLSRHAAAHAKAPSAAPASAFASLGGADWKSALSLALVEEARDKPARAAALAALAGLILGVLEGLDEKTPGGSGGA